MTELAKGWRNVPKVQRVCSANVLKTPRNAMPPTHGLERKESDELLATVKMERVCRRQTFPDKYTFVFELVKLNCAT